MGVFQSNVFQNNVFQGPHDGVVADAYDVGHGIPEWQYIRRERKKKPEIEIDEVNNLVDEPPAVNEMQERLRKESEDDEDDVAALLMMM